MAPSALPSFSSSFLFPLKTQKSFKPPKPLTIICSSQEPKKPSKNPQRPTSRNRKRTPYGTSRRSILKITFTQEQVKFTAGVSADPHVGIIGGGMAGLLCALSLEKRGVKSTVFDTGMHGLGGRMGTRVIDPQQLIFDHAAQFFTVSDSRFSKLVDYWLEKGLVREWQGLVGQLELGGRFVPLPSSPPRFIGVNGMRPLADSLLSEIADYLQSDGACPEEFAVGLEKEFEAIEGHDIGQFALAGVESSLKQHNEMSAFQLAT
ncbi:hypothetical protein ERO13_A07G068900v2 [Gossypium hirsutum]|nr:hypothetical protein ERO13_A07G068900v2 [Gossypium hirsutum]